MNPTPDAALLKLLRNATLHLSAEEICSQLHWAPSQLADRLAALRESQYEIEEHPLLGIKLHSAPDRLIADDLFPEAGRIGNSILVFEETASTNDLIAKIGREGGPDGLAIFAEKQTGGRGRLGRRWESEGGQGIYLSLLLRPSFDRQHWVNLTTWAAVAVAKAIERVLPCEAQIKWPNDIYIQGMKTVGILSELHLDKNSQPFAIVGIGVNVNQTAFPDFLAAKASSLRMIAGKKIDRRELAVRILEELENSYAQIGSSFSKLVHEADQRSYLRGRWIRLEAGTTLVEGTAGHLDETGALEIIKGNGEVVKVSSGEVTVSGIALR